VVNLPCVVGTWDGLSTKESEELSRPGLNVKNKVFNPNLGAAMSAAEMKNLIDNYTKRGSWNCNEARVLELCFFARTVDHMTLLV